MKSKYSKNDLTKLLAFCVMILAAIILLLNAIGIKLGILMFVKDAAILAAISLPAYAFAKSLGKTWVIIFWVIFVVFAVGLVWGGYNALS